MLQKEKVRGSPIPGETSGDVVTGGKDVSEREKKERWVAVNHMRAHHYE